MKRYLTDILEKLEVVERSEQAMKSLLAEETKPKLKTSEIVTQLTASEYVIMEEINNILSEDKIGWENSPTNISKIIKQKMTTSPNDKTIKKIKKWVTSQQNMKTENIKS